jgi:maltooligosyltrehalose trehalohydrolase
MPVGDEREVAWEMRFGARLLEGDRTEFRLWAPRLRSAGLKICAREPFAIPMKRTPDDEFEAIVPNLASGTDYLFVLDGARERPDPVSRWQPQGVHGPSRVVDPSAFQWSDGGWKGITLRDFLIYELHTGTFTREGTFESIMPMLPYLKELGITAVELMPVAECPGTRNWGYDGVDLYAPQSSYGGPRGLKRLVNECHASGLAVVLDVVYNHLGPEGNYLNEFAPFFTPAYRTPWGEAINFDGPDSDGVRRFFIDNALYWLTEYHVDALRLDAVHGIFDFSARHILEELTEAFHQQARRLGRTAWIIAESDLDDVRIISPKSLGGYGVDAQWHDDFHHSLHACLTGTNRGYMVDFGRLEQLARGIREGFVFDGRYSAYRRRRFGSSSKDRPGEQFVVFIQNHDQVANASQGRRLASLVSLEQQKLAATLVLLSPFLPLLFMGQEYGETVPFLYFTNFGDAKLSSAVREGRRKEFAAFGTDAAFADPEDPSTLQRSRLEWKHARQSPYAEILRFYRDVIALRKEHPCLANCRKDLVTVAFQENKKWLALTRRDPASSPAVILANFMGHRQVISLDVEEGNWDLALWSGAPAYGGSGAEPPPQSLVKEEGNSLEIAMEEFGALVYLQSGSAR